MSDRFPAPDGDSAFSCPSGCIGPEACINAANIRALDVTRRKLDEVLDDKGHIKAIKATQGNLGSLGVRANLLKVQHSALLDGCELYRLQDEELISEAINLEDMPPLD